jgi:hypothetical protein
MEWVKKDSTDWYERVIEEPIRDVVRLLRNNGFNTECSCAHKMYVQCQYILDGEFQELNRLVSGYLDSKKMSLCYDITVTIRVIDGTPFSSLLIDLNPKY